jgi:hypothetical protein
MRFEKVHTIMDFHDCIRAGTADFHGAPHYFSSPFDVEADDYVDHFRLYPVSAQFRERALRCSTLFQAWETKFHHGLVPLETHPGHGGIDAHYDELSRWLDEQIKRLDPIPTLHTATFRARPGQEQLPVGAFRALEVAWTLASASLGTMDCVAESTSESDATMMKTKTSSEEGPGGDSPSQLIDARIRELGDWRGETLARVRALIHEADPDVIETWKWRGVPVWEHGGIICTGETYKTYVKLTFAKGASLDDPARLFNASLEGNARRAIDIHEGDRIDAEALKTLIRAAVALNTAKPARTPKKPKSA